MEHQGLVRALNFLKENFIEVDTLITDRHKQIAKYMRQTHPDITHQYDVWHISKGSVVHHLAMYWSNTNCRHKEEVGSTLQ